MANNFPTIGEYNELIRKNGGNAFKLLNGISFIPSRTTPIKVYVYGSGTFAVVFKGEINGDTLAIRCFLSAENETISRYKVISEYLKKINSEWKTECEFLENEITFNGHSYPILKMEWIDGLLINQFVSNHISKTDVLTELQKKLITISSGLERYKIGHGDLQCGNIIVTGMASNFKLKLIDYDGMFVPELVNKKAIEKGRSEFQHPNRTEYEFDHEMDRFSFWVMLTALEAIKLDKSLWKEVMQGGFNTLDNFLFTIQDFINPDQSKLFNRLYGLNSSSLDYYLDKLKRFCKSEYSLIEKPVLSGEPTKEKHVPKSTSDSVVVKTTANNKYRITANNGSYSVLTSTLQKLGSTPLELNKSEYEGKLILVSNGKDTKRLTLNSHQSEIQVNFE